MDYRNRSLSLVVRLVMPALGALILFTPQSLGASQSPAPTFEADSPVATGRPLDVPSPTVTPGSAPVPGIAGTPSAVPVGMTIGTDMPTSTAAPVPAGSVWSWGNNGFGQVGDRTSSNTRPFPVQAIGPAIVVSVGAGQGHSLAADLMGNVWSWGANWFGQIGNGTTADQPSPAVVPNLSGVTSVAGGYGHSLAATYDGTVWAWGSNSSGQLGDGTHAGHSSPVRVQSLSRVKTISAGQLFNLALRADGTVWAWGSNSDGQLGDGTRIDRPVPVRVAGLTNVIAIAAAARHGLAVKSDGTVWAWGRNASSQLGDGTTTDRLSPVQVRAISRIVSVAGGLEHSLALRVDGTAWAWGGNSEGQLGDGGVDSRRHPVPEQVAGLSGVARIASGGAHNLAVMLDGGTFAWGRNAVGQLGDGSASTSSKAIPEKVAIGVASASAGLEHNVVFAGATVPSCDVNLDHVCDAGDVAAIGEQWLRTGNPGWVRADVNGDGRVDLTDVKLLAQDWGKRW